MRERIGDICILKSGTTLCEKDLYDDGEIPYVKVSDMNLIGNEKYITTSNKYVNNSINERMIFPEGTIIFPKRGGAIGTNKKRIASKAICADLNTMGVIPTKFVRPLYLYYYFLNVDFRKLYNGSSVPQINNSDIAPMEIDLPSLKEQDEIVSILDNVDSLLLKKRREIFLLDTLIKARFVEMFGDMADPACMWPVCRLIEACDENDDIKCGPFGTQLSKDEYQKTGIPVWEIPQINSAFAIAPEHFLTVEKATQLQAYSLSVGDIVMSRKGNVGKCAMFPADKPKGILHSDVLRIRVSRNKTNPCFMMCQLHFSRDIIRQIELVSSGAIMAGVNVTKLKDIIVKMPPLDLQNQFAAFVSQIDKSKVIIKEALDKSQILFNSLIQQYFG